MITSFTLNLPVAEDAFGRWLEEHGVNISISVMLGRYHVTVEWRKIHSYSDADGLHYEEWSLSRTHANRSVALEEALTAAMRLTNTK